MLYHRTTPTTLNYRCKLNNDGYNVTKLISFFCVSKPNLGLHPDPGPGHRDLHVHAVLLHTAERCSPSRLGRPLLFRRAVGARGSVPGGGAVHGQDDRGGRWVAAAAPGCSPLQATPACCGPCARPAPPRSTTRGCWGTPSPSC